MKLYQKIARVVSQENTAKKSKELALLQELLPNGNVIGLQELNLSTVGCVILLKSTKKRIVIDTVYWHHQVVITPSFEGEINIIITGKNLYNVKEYLHNIFREALMSEVVCNF